MAEILKGAPVAAAITESLTVRAADLRAKGIIPTLAVVRIGEREDDLSYENAARKRCEKIGIAFRRYVLPEDCTKVQLLDVIDDINGDDGIHGCLLFRPLPDREMERAACEWLCPEKDVDGMTDGSLAGVFTGRDVGFAPCTAQACVEILHHYGVMLEGRRAVVIGRSLVIGRPVSMMLQQQHATVTMCHSRTAELPAVCRQAEVLIAAAGKAGTVTAEYTVPGQVVVDVGIHVKEDGTLCGDVDYASVEPLVSAITPVPGGVGSVTTAVLCKHVLEAAERRAASCGRE